MLRFPVHVTVGAMLTSVVSGATAIAPYVPQLATAVVQLFGNHAGSVVAAAPIVSALASIIAGLGASPLPKRSSTTMTPQGSIADAVVAFVDANKTAILADLANANVPVANAVEAFAATQVAKVPVIGPILENALKGAGPQLVTYLGGEEAALFAVADGWLHAEAKALGG